MSKTSAFCVTSKHKYLMYNGHEKWMNFIESFYFIGRNLVVWHLLKLIIQNIRTLFTSSIDSHSTVESFQKQGSYSLKRLEEILWPDFPSTILVHVRWF